MNDQNSRRARLRYTATGALAAIVVVGAIAGTEALAAKPSASTHGHAVVANCRIAKAPASPASGKTGTSQPDFPQPFLTDVQQLVNNGTISTAEGQVLDREIQAGRIDTQTLASSGFTPTQLHAVQQALSNTKRALASAAPGTSK